jgi:ComF family protein
MLSISLGAILDRCLARVQRAMPATCVLCGASSLPQRLCRACGESLPRLPRSQCRSCALPLESGDFCGTCLAAPPTYDGVAAAFIYQFPVDALVQKYKYGPDLTLAPILGRLLGTMSCGEVDAVVAMPLGDSRLRSRGFNQAQELARVAARMRGLPLLARACRKVSETPPQASLPWKERAANVRGSFVCDADLRGQRVAVVDDVMTTGATLNELARVLKRAGAQSVRAWVVARTLPETASSSRAWTPF